MKIIPAPNELTAPYWEAAHERRLSMQRCTQCGRLSHPPVVSCPRCHSRTFRWDEMSGRGSIYTFTVVAHSVHPVSANATPYIIALVELAEGPRILANLRGCEVDDVRIGLAVEVLFEDVDDAVALPQFTPAQDPTEEPA
jgi:uncharacterized OB-fold protein